MKIRWGWDRDPVEAPPAPPPPLPEEDELLGLGPIELGERAETLLRDPLLRAALAKMRRKTQVAWLRSKAGESDMREECHRMMLAIDNFEAELKLYIGSKKIIEHARKQEAA